MRGRAATCGAIPPEDVEAAGGRLEAVAVARRRRGPVHHGGERGPCPRVGIVEEEVAEELACARPRRGTGKRRPGSRTRHGHDRNLTVAVAVSDRSLLPTQE